MAKQRTSSSVVSSVPRDYSTKRHWQTCIPGKPRFSSFSYGCSAMTAGRSPKWGQVDIWVEAGTASEIHCCTAMHASHRAGSPRSKCGVIWHDASNLTTGLSETLITSTSVTFASTRGTCWHSMLQREEFGPVAPIIYLACRVQLKLVD